MSSVPVTQLENYNKAEIKPDPIIIIGTGPVGIRALQTLHKIMPEQPVVIYGNEPWEPYNRVQLSSFLAGDLNWDSMVRSQSIPDNINIIQHHNCAVSEINTERKSITDELGKTQHYHKLIIATGSHPHVPNVDGVNLKAVYTFRDMSDVQSLLARRVSSRHTVIVGAGVLGLEAARAMQRLNTHVTVIDHSPRLMNRQLDTAAAEQLMDHVLALGIKITLGNGIKSINGDGHVSSITLINGKEIKCDTVILSTGIQPNIELARTAGISVGRGIRVNDTMQTSNKDVYAIGECAEHRGNIYGLVAPGYEQAEVTIHNLSGKKSSYKGSIAATKLKVIGFPVFSMGRVGEEESSIDLNELIYSDPNKKIYRKLVLFRGHLVGAMSTGEWSSLSRVQEAITHQRKIWLWQTRRFKQSGELWTLDDSTNVANWPASTIICNCMNVSRGECTQAINAGCNTLPTLMESTQASTVCGSCRPLVTELLGKNVKPTAEAGAKTLLSLSGVALVAMLVAFLLPAISYSTSVDVIWQWDQIWRNNLIKQITGYSILGLTFIGLVLTLRKRWQRFTFLKFSSWRLVHVILGVLGITALLAHTGFTLGQNLNFYLMTSFLSLILVGAISGGIIALQHKFDISLGKQLRDKFIWIHILLFWPVPVLLGFHVLKTYYF